MAYPNAKHPHLLILATFTKLLGSSIATGLPIFMTPIWCSFCSEPPGAEGSQSLMPDIMARPFRGQEQQQERRHIVTAVIGSGRQAYRARRVGGMSGWTILTKSSS